MGGPGIRKRRQNQQLGPRGPVEAGVKQSYSETQHPYIVFAGQGQQRGRSERRHNIGMDSHSSAGKSWDFRNQIHSRHWPQPQPGLAQFGPGQGPLTFHQGL